MQKTAFVRFWIVFLLLIRTSGLAFAELIEATTEASTEPWELIVDPENLENIIENIPYTVNLTLIYSGNDPPVVYQTEDAIFVVRINCTSYVTIRLTENSINYTWADVVEGNNKTITVTGNVIGYSDLTFELDVIPGVGVEVIETFPLLSGYHVTVLRATNLWDHIFTM